ncbi:type II toxin-antitoxin system RnlA family toxin [Candidatus Gottesmanbacteria bacterium]|nr:type II toxin-antitoxin system RnlA family toxin [Candidatus Gottesmanbacteria bacterium]
MIDKDSQLWKYLSDGQKGLVEESFFLLEDIEKHPDTRLTDYSYLVFPIAKAYEGFLKQLFLDRGYINQATYQSNHFRLGKALSPHMTHHLGDVSVYFQIQKNCGREVAEKIWQMWKRGRNLIFHYFPHNLRAVSLQEAREIIYDFVRVMSEAMYECRQN